MVIGKLNIEINKWTLPQSLKIKAWVANTTEARTRTASDFTAVILGEQEVDREWKPVRKWSSLHKTQYIVARKRTWCTTLPNVKNWTIWLNLQSEIKTSSALNTYKFNKTIKTSLTKWDASTLTDNQRLIYDVTFSVCIQQQWSMPSLYNCSTFSTVGRHGQWAGVVRGD